MVLATLRLAGFVATRLHLAPGSKSSFLDSTPYLYCDRPDGTIQKLFINTLPVLHSAPTFTCQICIQALWMASLQAEHLANELSGLSLSHCNYDFAGDYQDYQDGDAYIDESPCYRENISFSLDDFYLPDCDKKEDLDHHLPHCLDEDNMDDPPRQKLFVGGISWDITDEVFRNMFARYGTVIEATVMQGRGFGFVTFKEPEAALAVLNKPLLVDGRKIDCKIALPKAGSQGGQHVRKVFVGGIPPQTTSEILCEHFKLSGKIVNAVVMVDHTTGCSRGFGFVTFETEESVNAVLNKPQMVLGKLVECRKAISKQRISRERRRRSRHRREAMATRHGYGEAGGRPAVNKGVYSGKAQQQQRLPNYFGEAPAAQHGAASFYPWDHGNKHGNVYHN
eukprot:g16372.t1